jgi:Glycine zipper
VARSLKFLFGSKCILMKRTILALSATFLFAACKQKSAQNQLNNYPPDTATYKNTSVGAQGAVGYPATYHNTPAHKVYHHRTTYVSRSSYPARTTVTRRRGWSSAAKGTVIGAGSGAVLGAVLSKDHHRVQGAVIGGAVGAAGGYLYGRHRDKKNRRY